MPIRTITRFEHDTLKLGEQSFNQCELDALTKWQDKQEKQYFTRIYDGIKFCQWVGIIQLPSLTLEILPKTDKTVSSLDSSGQWRTLLLHMIEVSVGLSPATINNSRAVTRNSNIFQLFIRLFISEVEELISIGLIKRYRFKNLNRSAVLKGRLLIDKQIKLNSCHNEVFACRYPFYDKSHYLHDILKTALTKIMSLYLPIDINAKIQDLLLYFDENQHINATKSTFDHIKWDRKNNHYFRSIQLARLILIGLSPDFYVGKENIVSFLIDMNDLFETFIASLIQKSSKKYGNRVRLQCSHTFWEKKLVRPDIVIGYRDRKIVIDTKWKIPEKKNPADIDLKQMFVYNKIIGCSNSILLYPSSTSQQKHGVETIRDGKYFDGSSCSMWEVNLLLNGKPDKEIGSVIIEKVINSFS